MDIKLKRSALLKALEKCAHPSGIKDDQREYAGRVMITVNVQEKTASFYAVDTYLCVDTAVLLDEVEAGRRVAVDTKRLQIMVTNLPGEVVHLVAEENRIVVTGDRKRRYTTPTCDASLFPPLREPSKEAPSISMPGPKLSYLLRRVEHSCEENKARPTISGIQLHAEIAEGKQMPEVSAVSTDGYKMCVATHHVLVTGQLPFNAFLPARLIKLLLPLLDHEENITLSLDHSSVYASTQDSLFGALLPRDPFIEWEAVLRQTNPMEPICSLPTVATLEALRAISAVKTTHGACVRFHIEDDLLYLDLFNDPTNASDAIPIKKLTNRKSFTFYSNPRFVIDHLRGADADCEMRDTNAHTIAFCTSDGYFGMLVPIDAKSIEAAGAAKPSSKTDSKKNKGPGPGRGGKKKTTKKTAKVSRKPDPEPTSEEEEDELGSADPSQYTEE